MSGPRTLLGVDIGAGSLKASVVSLDGRVLGTASYDLATSCPCPGWTEQDPDDWYRAFCAAVPRALAQAEIKGNAVEGIAFSAGAHTPVLTDADGTVLRPAILWSDQRAGAEARELRERSGARILEIGYNAAHPTWTMPQLLWLARHEPHIVSKAKRLFVAKDYLRFRVTGTWETDTVDALGTLLLDAARTSWSPELAAMVNWPLEALPPIVQPTAVVGKVTAAAAADSGLAAGTPVVAGSSDTAVEIFGAGAIAPGDGSIKLATAATVSVIGETPAVSPDLINYYYVVSGLWYTITGTNSCASAHKWLRDTFFRPTGVLEADGAALFQLMDKLAGEVRPGSDGLVFHPYLNGERSPHWDPLLRADFIGVTMRHQRGHFVRALYEGIAFSIRDCFEVFQRQGLGFDHARLVGGGARSAVWRQIVSDVLGIAIEVPRVGDASFGAALIAGLGVGAFSDAGDAVRRCVRVVEESSPDPRRHDHYSRLFQVYRQAQQQLAVICHQLHSIEQDGAALDWKAS